MLRDWMLRTDRPSPVVRWTTVGAVLLAGFFAADLCCPGGASQALGQGSGSALSAQDRNRLYGEKPAAGGADARANTNANAAAARAPAAKEAPPAEVVEGAATSDRIIEGFGWKDLRIGMKRENAIKALGKPDGDSAGELLRWPKKSVECKLDGAGVTEIHFLQGFKGSLASGIKLGSPINDVLKTYGEPKETRFMQPGRLLLYPDRGIQFAGMGVQVVAIIVVKGDGSAPPVALPSTADADEEGNLTQTRSAKTGGPDNIVEGMGWKNLRIGMSKKDVLKAMGAADNNSRPDLLQWGKMHIECGFFQGDAAGVTELRFMQGFQGAMSNGIKLGSSGTDLLRAYGEPSHIREDKGVKFYEYSEKGVMFWSVKGKITMITVMKPNQLQSAQTASDDDSEESPQNRKATTMGSILDAAILGKSINQMKAITLAMLNYESEKKCFPPAFTADDDGEPFVSWRVLILPYLNQKALFDQFHLKEPWNSPHNKELISKMPDVFKNPKGNPGEGKTNYLAVRGAQTVLFQDQGIPVSAITDGTSNTVVTVEVNDDKAVIWTQPDDFPHAPAAPSKGLGGLWEGGFLVGVADGAVALLPSTIPPKTLNALFTRNGKEPINIRELLHPKGLGATAVAGQNPAAADQAGASSGGNLGAQAGASVGAAIGQAFRSFTSTTSPGAKNVPGADEESTGGMNSPAEQGADATKADAEAIKAAADEAIIAECQKTLETRPDAAEAHFILANALTRQGRNDEAFIHFQKAQDLKPDYAEAHYGFGKALAHAGQMAAAIGQFQRALELRPDYPEARASLIVARHPQSKAAKEAEAAILRQAALAETPAANASASDRSADNPGMPAELKYDDGRSDGQRSYADSGEMIQYTLPTNTGRIAGIRVFGARYGLPEPPNEDFTIYILNEDGSKVLCTETAPYGLFQRGNAQWFDVNFKRVRDVPKTFWIVLNFKAQPTKGVFVHYDTRTGGKHSKIGLPGKEPENVDFGGDWMIRVRLAGPSANPQNPSEPSASGDSRRSGATADGDTSENRSPGGVENASVLKYDDGKPDGRKSLAGSTEMIQFSLPTDAGRVKGIRIHGARYGLPQAPVEDFTISALNEDMSETLFTENAPYKLFQRGKARWVDVTFKRPHEVPQTFWIALDFKAQEAKGVYVSYDTDVGGGHSKIGMSGPNPGGNTAAWSGGNMEDDDSGPVSGQNMRNLQNMQNTQNVQGSQNAKDVDFGGDWMIRVNLAK